MGAKSSEARLEEEGLNTELYARLHVSPSASAEEIRKAFLYWSAVAHPDKHLDPQLKDAATENFRQIVEAYDILTDPDKRQIYDIYGMEGLSSGLEVGPHLKKAEEIKEELEKLKRRKEHEKVLAQSPASVRLFATLSLPEYLAGGSIMNRMQMYSGVQSHLSKSNTLSISGNFAVSGNTGIGSANAVLTHRISSVTQVDFLATAGLRSVIGLQASRQLSSHSKATSGFTVSLRDGSINLSNAWTRQLSETSIGNIELVLGTESSISVEWKKKEEKTAAAGLLKLGTNSFGASANYTYHFSRRSHCRVAGNIGSTLDFEIGGGRKISDSSMVRVVYSIGIEGITWRFELHKGGQKLLIPVLLSHELNPFVATGALMIPSSLYFLVKKFILKPYYLRRERQKAIKEKEKCLDQIRKAREAAKKAQKLLENASNRKKNNEVEKDGLVITKAIYGNIQAAQGRDEHFEVNDDATSLVLDVTLPLNFLVTNSQLELHKGIKKSGLMGFCDPCPGEPKQLLVEYTFKGQNYKVLVDDYDLLRIPQSMHRI
ncbi:chaperone protein dnaJ 13 [Canna indica]|uniref:Chaperone protein dnaJ 13 n=1 Tax=Canna indica TaxID=4628 RepID=A0AAQ3KLL4_9LILI|nr:chaperone protein dnaJ 13 [Canna indica]